MKKRGGGGGGTDRPEREDGETGGDDEPNEAISKKILYGADENQPPEREKLTECTCKETNTVAEIFGNSETGYLLLVVIEGGFNDGGDASIEIPNTSY